MISNWASADERRLQNLCGAPATLNDGAGISTDCATLQEAPAALDDRELDACLIVRDKNGQALRYIYFEDEPGRRSAANLLTKKLRRVAANVAKLPDLLRRGRLKLGN